MDMDERRSAEEQSRTGHGRRSSGDGPQWIPLPATSTIARHANRACEASSSSSRLAHGKEGHAG
jgi:hypothetical protein